MKKNILLLLSILLLTGCTVDYNLEIKNNKIIENISGTVLKNEYELKKDDPDINLFYSMLFFDQYPVLNGTDIYNKKIDNIDDGVKYSFDYTYKNNYANSRIINSCIENVNITDENDYYYFDLSGDFYCLYSDEIVININTDYAVLEHNANRVKDNTYTWIIDKNDVNIKATVSKNISNNVEGESKPNYFRIIGFVVLVILSGITYFLYKKKNSGKI